MKKKIYLFTTILLMSLGVHAQEWALGAKAGVNFASFSGDDAQNLNFEGRTGFHLGLILEMPLTDDFSIQPEVLYSTLGGNTNEASLEQATDLNFKMDYISVPVLVKYYFWGNLNLEAGPQFSFNTRNDIEGQFGGQDISEDFQSETRTIDVGGAVGLAYNSPIGFFGQIRYIPGFTKVFREVSFEGGEATDLKNSLIQLSLGMKF